MLKQGAVFRKRNTVIKRDTIKVRYGIVNDDSFGKVGRPRAAITDANSEAECK